VSRNPRSRSGIEAKEGRQRMDIVIMAVIGGLIGFAYDQWRRRRVAVQWSKTVIAQLPEAVAAKATAEYCEARGWVPLAQYCKEKGVAFNPTKGGGFAPGGIDVTPFRGGTMTDQMSMVARVGERAILDSLKRAGITPPPWLKGGGR